MRKILIALALMLLPMPALAAGTLYRGSLEVPSNGTITLDAGGSGCGVFVAGVLSNAACPSGTATFLGGTNITVTGSNPYTINCPNCFNFTQPTTVSGTVLFNAATTFSAAALFSGGITSSSTVIPISIGTTNNFSPGITMGTTGGFAVLSTTSSSIATCNVVGNELALTAPNSGPLVDTFDQSGNFCAAGTIYYVSSEKEKQHIRAANIDALSVIRGADFNLFWQYKPGIGDPKQVHYGAMAESLPSYISGENHGRVDLQALVNTEGAAIGQLADALDRARMAIVMLTLWCLILTIVVVRGR